MVLFKEFFIFDKSGKADKSAVGIIIDILVTEELNIVIIKLKKFCKDIVLV